MTEGTTPAAARTTGDVWMAVLLVVLAVAAVWAAFAGYGPAELDRPALGESIEARSPVLTTVAVAVTTIGNTAATAVLAVLVGAFRWYRGRRADAVLAVVAMGTAALVFTTIKRVLDRPRPPVADRLVSSANESLPSGHATMSMVVVGTIVVLSWGSLGGLRRAVLVVVAAAWVGAVGATRVYLGVHWFSDVIAGWLVGAAWLAVCVVVWKRWSARAVLE
ncbi:phosphatase PAP2 family protein [Pseudonocardia sp.]|jgi:membrane-associated phospholipid phosphatase|uniref:phosphatase PAP2 family protein n=1 Tax=Pseudonocardia sp. TaxID=60912 RepID=UPI002624D5EC|nr:phosphatase PAP2 family protein [Pseudonocardia sp.]MCW2720574.1 phosphoesterase PA-phosphatase related protein [Pseudonocardia sp.]MDT7618492.1 hypothetical protein [Pseudonocardiales bacterium]